MKIEYASEIYFEYMLNNDKHISKEIIKNKIKGKGILVAKNQDNIIIGWLRYNYFLG